MIFRVLRLMEFEKHLSIIQLPEDLQLSLRRRHTVAKSLALTILHTLRFVHDPRAFYKRHLETVFHAAHRSTLEHIIRQHANRCQLSQQRAEYLRIVVHAL